MYLFFLPQFSTFSILIKSNSQRVHLMGWGPIPISAPFSQPLQAWKPLEVCFQTGAKMCPISMAEASSTRKGHPHTPYLHRLPRCVPNPTPDLLSCLNLLHLRSSMGVNDHTPCATQIFHSSLDCCWYRAEENFSATQDRKEKGRFTGQKGMGILKSELSSNPAPQSADEEAPTWKLACCNHFPLSLLNQIKRAVFKFIWKMKLHGHRPSNVSTTSTGRFKEKQFRLKAKAAKKPHPEATENRETLQSPAESALASAKPNVKMFGSVFHPSGNWAWLRICGLQNRNNFQEPTRLPLGLAAALWPRWGQWCKAQCNHTDCIGQRSALKPQAILPGHWRKQCWNFAKSHVLSWKYFRMSPMKSQFHEDLIQLNGFYEGEDVSIL